MARRATLLGEGALIVLHNVGHLLRFIAVLPLALLPVAVVYDEWRTIPAVLLTSLMFFVLGWVLKLLPTPREPRLREGMIIAAVGWLLVPLGSMLIFTRIEGWTAADGFFESMSAWTGTGMTLADVSLLTHTTLAWRSLMQWIGGLGVIVLTLAILARPGTGSFTLYASEAREEKLRPSVLGTVRTLWWIYLILTVGATVLLVLVGLPWWEAINHGMTGIATGGMTVIPGGIGAYTAPSQQWAFVPIMLAGSIPFVVTYALFRGHWRTLVRDEQVRAMMVLLLVAIPLVAWKVGHATGVWSNDGVRDAVFQVTSAITTTGFQTADVSGWPHNAKLMVAGLLLLGGAAGSTAGGIKLVRGVLLVKGAAWKLQRSGLPHFAVTPFNFGGERLNEREANEEFAEAAFIGFLWMTLLFVSALVFLTILPESLPLSDVLFDLASTQSNNGLTTGVIGSHLGDGQKIALASIMWAGRLEILPVLLVLRGLLPRFGKR